MSASEGNLRNVHDQFRRISVLKQERDTHQRRCQQFAQRIAAEEREHGKLLLEAEGWRKACERRAVTIREDKLAEQQERALLDEKEQEISALRDLLLKLDAGNAK